MGAAAPLTFSFRVNRKPLPAHGIALTTFRIGVPTSVNIVQKFPHRHTRECASLMFLAFLNPIKLISYPALFFTISRVAMGPSLVPCRTALPPSLFAVLFLEWEDSVRDRSGAQGIYVASKWFDFHQHLFVESGVVGIPYSLGCVR